MAMLFSGFGSGFCEAATASTRAVPALLALTLMLKLDEAPLARVRAYLVIVRWPSVSYFRGNAGTGRYDRVPWRRIG
jgi:hypothetical protein